MEGLGISLWDAEVRDTLGKKCFWKMAQELLELGQSVILEYGFWSREEREQMRQAARSLGVEVELHYLDVSIEELKGRLTNRGMEGDLIIRNRIEKYAGMLEAPDESELRLYDTWTKIGDNT